MTSPSQSPQCCWPECISTEYQKHRRAWRHTHANDAPVRACSCACDVLHLQPAQRCSGAWTLHLEQSCPDMHLSCCLLHYSPAEMAAHMLLEVLHATHDYYGPLQRAQGPHIGPIALLNLPLLDGTHHGLLFNEVIIMHNYCELQEHLCILSRVNQRAVRDAPQRLCPLSTLAQSQFSHCECLQAYAFGQSNTCKSVHAVSSHLPHDLKAAKMLYMPVRRSASSRNQYHFAAIGRIIAALRP